MKRFAFKFLYAIGATRFCAWRKRKEIRILCYHGVTKRTDRSDQTPLRLHVRYDRFIRHLDYLQSRYHVISLSEFLAAQRVGNRLPDYSVILTFDDGHRNFLTVIASSLAQRGMPASVFLITDRIKEISDPSRNGQWTPADDEECLSWSEALGLRAQQQVEFGSHTCSHMELPDLAPQATSREIMESYHAISSHIKDAEIALAYPRGKYSEAVIEEARSVGYACALTTDVGTNDMNADLFKLKRILIGDDDDEAAFAGRVSGLAHWVRGLTRLGRF